jgi:hypothetical protein
MSVPAANVHLLSGMFFLLKHYSWHAEAVLQGLRTLVDMMDENYRDQKDLVWMAVDGICRVFDMQVSPSSSCQIGWDAQEP